MTETSLQPRRKRASRGVRYQTELNFDTEEAKQALQSRIDSPKRYLPPRASFLDNAQLLSLLLDKTDLEKHLQTLKIIFQVISLRSAHDHFNMISIDNEFEKELHSFQLQQLFQITTLGDKETLLDSHSSSEGRGHTKYAYVKLI